MPLRSGTRRRRPPKTIRRSIGGTIRRSIGAGKIVGKGPTWRWERPTETVARWRAPCLQLVELLALLGRQDLANLALDLLVDPAHFGKALLQDRVELRAMPLENGVRVLLLLRRQTEFMQRQGTERWRPGRAMVVP